MAEIAAIFHWPHSELAAMTIEQLAQWRNAAVRTWNALNKSGKG